MSISTAMSCVSGDPYIRLKVKGQDGTELFFKIRRYVKLKRLMDVFCERCAVNMISTVFLFNGRRLQGKETPDELEMEDGDEIDALLHQIGGTNG